ncbi:hypothetical protein [Rhizobium rhizogenes]|uniref:hypothetical protein n=1 Tax=Rhizobium rhizogenes TaxID=359 RepID=UPI0022BC081B|nr:hypothetical protein [Rhizobium rhizogenes]MCZ7462839.1 hypothetical protein [Rhizobium rhizogenes]
MNGGISPSITSWHLLDRKGLFKASPLSEYPVDFVLGEAARACPAHRPEKPPAMADSFSFLPVCGKVRAAMAKSFYKFYRLTLELMFLNFQARN